MEHEAHENATGLILDYPQPKSISQHLGFIVIPLSLKIDFDVVLFGLRIRCAYHKLEIVCARTHEMPFGIRLNLEVKSKYDSSDAWPK